MPASLPPWPALAGSLPEGPLVVHRAVLGKVHQAASDFRWITHTEAVRPRKLGLDQKLSLGPEDRPVRSPAWRSLGDAEVAIVSYRSRAVDRAGRSGGLEKQILYWPRPEPNQAVTGAFALLGALQEASDALWWEHWEDYRWDEPEFFLPREPEEIAPGRLDLAISQGLAELTGACSQQALAEFYAGLLAGAQPAALEGLAEPLPSLAIAALLLPFPPTQARRLSLAGALPNSRHLPASLANWNGVVRTAEQPELPDGGPSPTIEQQERGAVLAAAIFRGDPAGLTPVTPAPQPAAKPEPPPPPPPEPVPAPKPPPVVATVQANTRPSLSRAGERFEQFLRAGDEMRFLEAIPGNAAILSESEGEYLLDKARQAIADLEPQAQGEAPRARQLRAKIELIRAWLVCCCPRPETEQALQSAQNQKVPPLLFALTLDPDRWAAGCTLSRDEFGELVRACGRLKQSFTRSQMEAFGQWGRADAIRSLLRS